MILIDTSVWIDYFHKKPRIDLEQLDLFIESKLVTTCLPIYAEILSGQMSSQVRNKISGAFEAMNFIDLDWRQKDTWNIMINLAGKTRHFNLPIPGLIDRMILSCALKADAMLWTLDKHLEKLAQICKVEIFS